MNFRDSDKRERRDYLSKVVKEATELGYWISIAGKLYAPSEVAQLIMKDPLPHFTHENLILVDPVKILEQQDKKMADQIFEYNKRRNDFVRRINLHYSQKVK